MSVVQTDGSCEVRMKFAFIVLNYNTAEQTEKCIDSILERAGKFEDFKIGLLDNGSRDCSCRELVEKKYKFVVEGGGASFYRVKNKSWVWGRK